MDSQQKSILERMRHIEEAITKGREYLETGQYADWFGFRPLYVDKMRDGKVLPPHKDWVRNVFIPQHERGLRKMEKKLERLRGAYR